MVKRLITYVQQDSSIRGTSTASPRAAVNAGTHSNMQLSEIAALQTLKVKKGQLGLQDCETGQSQAGEILLPAKRLLLLPPRTSYRHWDWLLSRDS